ncbi:MAG: hypothetical protein KDC99_16170 [Cyclobacteriaceae bacterium]|nr:hypothetical protein [Cyclobacteriaceae bacterium]
MRLLVTTLLVVSTTLLSAQQMDMSLFKGMKPRNIGPAGMSGRVTSIDVVESNPEIIFIGTASGGLWRSDNGGTSFTPIFDHEKAASVGAVAVNQSNPAEIWVGTGEGNPRNSLTGGNGIYRSIDGGRTWTHMGLEATKNIHRVIINRDNPNIVYVGAIGSPWGEQQDRGVYKTSDGGKTWKKVLYVDPKTGVGDLVVDPSNPNKLIAAMWEHRRWPWYFNSGGPGSGLYISYDAGETWKKKTTADGLPKGELGRIGLAVAPSNPSIVYALVEAKKNGLYKSEDGGEKWSLVSTKNIGGRPFYYADIFVDSKNENRIYNLHTFVDVSNDGGKTFERLIDPSLVHVDNHAWYGHPTDENFVICGNDGGAVISHDRGKTWRFIENLPLAQFYHINVDNELPYNVYGGLQDNGSWRGPSAMWRRYGIRNMYWDRVGGGDGFDVVPDPLAENRYGYSLSQGGNISRYDLETGSRQFVKPFLASGEELRYNWNAGIAVDPIDKTTLYLGSQYLLKSTDRGASWEKISPDLTTNDPAKQKQATTGGLSLDNSGAENHTTILSIAPSPLQKGVIWVGTDDGNVQLTTDGGKTWANVISKMPGAPKNAWVTQIRASSYNANEAVVVINNYRQSDWSAYVYRTKDMGKTWTRIANDQQVYGYCLATVQDPVVSNLHFLGTEYGLYVSVDDAKTWSKWTSGYPTVSTMDLVIQSRDVDLVIGTFGRAVWILDDIRALREMAKTGYNTTVAKDIKAFEAPTAYLTREGEPNGYRSTGDGFYEGENKPFGAMLTYYVKDLQKAATEKDSVKTSVMVYDNFNKLIRTIKHKPTKGINRIYWGLDVKGERTPDQKKPAADAAERGGRSVTPGNYKVVFAYGPHKDSTMVEVKLDPEIQITVSEMNDKAALIDKLNTLIHDATAKVDRLRESKETVDLILSKLKEREKSEANTKLKQLGDSTKSKIDKLILEVNPPEDIQGFSDDPNLVSERLGTTRRYLQDTHFAPSETQRRILSDTEKNVKPVMDKIDTFFSNDWESFKKAVNDAQFSLFKE